MDNARKTPPEEILEQFHGRAEQFEGDIAYAVLVDSQGRKVDASFDADRLREKAIEEGDSFTYTIAKVQGNIVARFEHVSEPAISDEAWSQAQERITSLLGDYTADPA